MTSLSENIAHIRRDYAKSIANAANCADTAIEQAFAAVPREVFLPPPPWFIIDPARGRTVTSSEPADLYHDMLVRIDAGKGINNGQPSLHARWIAAASPKAGDSVVHVGCGGGYYSAILSLLVGSAGHVFAYEIEPSVAALARQALAAYANVTVIAESGAQDAIPAADIIYVNAAASAPQTAWLEAMNLGARLMFPWNFSAGGCAALLATRSDDADARIFSVRTAGWVAFIPMADAHQRRKDDISAEAVLSIRSLVPKSLARPDDSLVADLDDYWFSHKPPHHFLA